MKLALETCLKASEIDNPIEVLETLADLPRTIAATNDCSIVVFLDDF